MLLKYEFHCYISMNNHTFLLTIKNNNNITIKSYEIVVNNLLAINSIIEYNEFFNKSIFLAFIYIFKNIKNLLKENVSIIIKNKEPLRINDFRKHIKKNIQDKAFEIYNTYADTENIIINMTYYYSDKVYIDILITKNNDSLKIRFSPELSLRLSSFSRKINELIDFSKKFNKPIDIYKRIDVFSSTTFNIDKTVVFIPLERIMGLYDKHIFFVNKFIEKIDFLKSDIQSIETMINDNLYMSPKRKSLFVKHYNRLLDGYYQCFNSSEYLINNNANIKYPIKVLSLEQKALLWILNIIIYHSFYNIKTDLIIECPELFLSETKFEDLLRFLSIYVKMGNDLTLSIHNYEFLEQVEKRKKYLSLKTINID